MDELARDTLSFSFFGDFERAWFALRFRMHPEVVLELNRLSLSLSYGVSVTGDEVVPRAIIGWRCRSLPPCSPTPPASLAGVSPQLDKGGMSRPLCFLQGSKTAYYADGNGLYSGSTFPCSSGDFPISRKGGLQNGASTGTRVEIEHEPSSQSQAAVSEPPGSSCLPFWRLFWSPYENVLLVLGAKPPDVVFLWEARSRLTEEGHRRRL